MQNRLAFRIEDVGRRAAARLKAPWSKRRELREHLRRLLAELEIDTVLDVGANRGQYYRFLRHEVGYRGLVVSCEPIPELAADLTGRSAHDPHWQVQACALGAAPGTATLNVMARAVFSSLLTPDHSHTALYGEKNVVTRTVEVPVRTLADVVAGLPASAGRSTRRIYLKLDTQGYDLEVLRGGGAALERVAAMQSELSFVPLYHGMADWQQALAEINALGFAVSGFHSVTRDEALRLIEADAVFVRAPAGTPTAAALQAD